MAGFWRTNMDMLEDLSHSIKAAKDDKVSPGLVTKPKETEWTNEKHIMFLQSKEATFISQLHNAMNLRRQNQNQNQNQIRSSPQVMVLKGNFWKNNSEQEEVQSKNNAESRTLTANPWVRHFKSPCKDEITTPSISRETIVLPTAKRLRSNENKKLLSHGLSATSNCFPSWHSQACRQNSACSSNEEVSAQNFVDEDDKRGEVGNTCDAKRIKITKANGTSNDQVVPFRKNTESQT